MTLLIATAAAYVAPSTKPSSHHRGRPHLVLLLLLLCERIEPLPLLIPPLSLPLLVLLRHKSVQGIKP